MSIESNGHAKSTSDDSSGQLPAGEGGTLALMLWLAALARGVADDEDGQFTSDPGDTAKSIGPFRLESVLGQGAYGVVFRATDVELDRPVALKIAWPHILFDKVASKRFVEEPKIAAALDHPGIVRIYRSGWVDAVAYISFELIDGPTIGARLQRQDRIPCDVAARLIGEVADAVGYAHQKGIVHRDLKPSNILLRRCPDGSMFPFAACVGDFGLAHRARSDSVSLLTRTQDVIGTDPYMAPEQFDGGNRRTAPPSDVFSLGVILYELIAGRRPFTGETADETRRQIRLEDPPALRTLRPKVSRDLQTIVDKCLQKLPEARYASADHLAADLRRYLNHEPVLARRPSRLGRAWKYVCRKPLQVSMIVVVIFSALLIAGMLGALVADRRAAKREIAEAQISAAIADGSNRQREYVEGIQRAASLLVPSDRRNIVDFLQAIKQDTRDPVNCGLEWDYLWAQEHDHRQIIPAHVGPVWTVRFTSNGRVLASGARDARVKLWNVEDWSLLREFADDVEEATNAEFSADDALIAIGGDNGRVIVHSVADGAVLFDQVLAKGILALIWLGNQSRLAAAGEDGEILIIDIPGQTVRKSESQPVSEETRSQSDHARERVNLAFVPERQAIAIASSYRGAYLVDVASLSVQRDWSDANGQRRKVCHIPTGPGFLASDVSKFYIELWNAKTGEPLLHMMHQTDAYFSAIKYLRYSQPHHSLLALYRDGSTLAWDVDQLLSGERVAPRRYRGASVSAQTLDVSPTDGRVAVGRDDGQIECWNPVRPRQEWDVPLVERPWLAKFSPCARWLAVVDAQANQFGQLTVYDVKAGKAKWVINTQRAPGVRPHDYFRCSLWALDFDGKGTELVAQDSSGVVRGYDPATGAIIRIYPTLGELPLRSIRFSPDGQSLIAHSEVDKCRVIARHSGTVELEFANNIDYDLGSFSTVLGTQWMELPASHSILLRQQRRGSTTLTLSGAMNWLYAVAVSADGKNLAAGGADQMVHLWDLRAPTKVRHFIGHDRPVVDLAISKDSRTLLSRSEDGTVRFWHVETGAELLRLGSLQKPIVCMGLSPDGSLLVLGLQHEGRWGLQLHRLGPQRDSLPITMQLLKSD